MTYICRLLKLHAVGLDGEIGIGVCNTSLPACSENPKLVSVSHQDQPDLGSHTKML